MCCHNHPGAVSKGRMRAAVEGIVAHEGLQVVFLILFRKKLGFGEEDNVWLVWVNDVFTVL